MVGDQCCAKNCEKDEQVSAFRESSKRWQWGFLLHNLTCKQPFGSDYLAIAPHTDTRVQAIVANSSLGQSLLENFTDQFEHKTHPSVLIIREDAPESVRHIDAVVSFRNVFAFSCLIRSWQQNIGGPSACYPLFSDYFDFYPITLDADGIRIYGKSPALRVMGQPKAIHGQISAGLPNSEHLFIEQDDDLSNLLLKAWQHVYVNPSSIKSEARALFRSLQTAYHAAAMPMPNQQSIHDYGTRIALWISAFEILCHPSGCGGLGKADFEKVKELLETQTWSNSEMRDCKYPVTSRKACVNVNLVVALYWELYQARNDFLHGNPVSRNRLFPFRNAKRPPLLHLAPLIYKAGLLGFLKRFQSPADQLQQDLGEFDLCNPAWEKAVIEAGKTHAFETAILHAIQDRSD